MESSNATSTEAGTGLVAPSFITEVLASAGRLEKDDLNAKLGKLFHRIDEVKSEVYESIESEYERFLPYLHVAPNLTDRVEHLNTDVGDVTEKLQTEMKSQLKSSTTEFQELSAKLDEATHMSVLLEYLMDLHNLEKSALVGLRQGDYSKAGHALQIMQHKLNEISEDPVYGKCEVKILTALSVTVEKHMALLKSQLFESWGAHIKWNLPTMRKDKPQSTSGSVLGIQCSSEARRVLGNTIQGLHQLDLLEPKVKVFANLFMDHVMLPVVLEKKVVVIRETSSLHWPTKELQLKKKSSEPDLGQVFDVLITSFKFLNEHLGNMNTSMDEDEVPLMSIFQHLASEQLLKLIIDECLAPAIPTSKQDLERFNIVVDATQILQHTLSEMKLIADDENSLMEYVQSVNVLFANKKCQGILTQARGLMRSDIHDTVRISPDAPQEEVMSLLPEDMRKMLQNIKDKESTANLAMSSDVKLSAETFRLPTCRISVSTQQLVQLAYDVLLEATQCDEVCAMQLFGTVRQMFVLYVAVIPTYHKDSLAKLPQLGALHHNNCMYVAHHLLVMKHQFNSQLPGMLSTWAADFVDMVPGIRRMGTECFLKIMTIQKAQLSEYLSVANGFVSVSEENNQIVAVQAIRQVFHQLGLLSNVWRGVLPDNIYAKSLGTLLQSAIKEMVDHVVALDDISADDATELATLLGIFVQCSPALFTLQSDKGDVEQEVKENAGVSTDKDVNITKDKKGSKGRDSDQEGLAQLMQNVSKWGQLLELRIVLSASLLEISDQWADAKGPLAVQFSATEVKRLIRALFQNTDRRAAVLATIRQPVDRRAAGLTTIR